MTRPDFEQIRARYQSNELHDYIGSVRDDIDALLAAIDELESFRSAHAALLRSTIKDRQAIEAERAQHGVTVADLKSRLSGAAIDELTAENERLKARLDIAEPALARIESRARGSGGHLGDGLTAMHANDEMDRLARIDELEARNAKLEAVADQADELADAIVEYFSPAPPSEHFFEDLAVYHSLRAKEMP